MKNLIIQVPEDISSLANSFPDLTTKKFSNYCSTVTDKQVGSWACHLRDESWIDSKKIDPDNGWEHAGFGHLIAFAIEYPDEQLIKRIVALGAIYETKTGQQLPYLAMNYTTGRTIKNCNPRTYRSLSRYNIYSLLVTKIN